MTQRNDAASVNDASRSTSTDPVPSRQKLAEGVGGCDATDAAAEDEDARLAHDRVLAKAVKVRSQHAQEYD
jgi:hypothetical protein